MLQTRTLLLVAAALTSVWLGNPAQALEIIATTASLGALGREIGGEQIQLRVMAPSDRDPHDLLAKPSLISQARSADGLISIGAGLEEGWLPAVLEQAGNQRIQPGQAGSFIAASKVELIPETREANPLFGHIHKQGNPHIQMDPVRMAQLASALGEWLAQLDSANAAQYRQRAQQSAQRLLDFSQEAGKRLQSPPGVALYHEDAVYFLSRFNIPLLGTLEPFPGVPPTASHLQELTTALRGKRGIIVRTPYQAGDGARMLAQESGLKEVVLPIEPSMDATLPGYLAMLEQWVAALAYKP
ncbi:MAG: metal ABC transporter substrate-binding protein [Pseudomonadota bacterium]